jgi:hypothetical protein
VLSKVRAISNWHFPATEVGEASAKIGVFLPEGDGFHDTNLRHRLEALLHEMRLGLRELAL